MAFTSVFDMLKVGIGPSSSHTLGPWRASERFISALLNKNVFAQVNSIQIDLYGSLALTGKGHGTDIAVFMGLSGFDPVTVPIKAVDSVPTAINESKTLLLNQELEISLDPEKNVHFHIGKSLPFHPNGMKLTAFNKAEETLLEETYYSIGGGFVVQEGQDVSKTTSTDSVPFPFTSANDLIILCESHKLSLPEILRQNECAILDEDRVEKQLSSIANEMLDCVYRGCHQDGELPGGLNVRRRAHDIYEHLRSVYGTYADRNGWIDVVKQHHPPFPEMLQWISCFAMAVNEENANFSRVVTAPTNGAAGVIPAVLLYFICFSGKKVEEKEIQDFLLVSSVVGALFKDGATISAAMGGCQAEIGVSSSMAAAALTSGLGGSPAQAFMAAEIAMEHHLGLTCDPIKGLVQIPCIERNTMGAVKAITAGNLALASDPEDAKVSLDDVISTMWDTAQDMSAKYKETSQGGLATNISVIVPEC